MIRRLVAGLMLVAGLVPALNAQESPLAAPPKELDQIKWMVGQWSGTMSSTMGDIKTVMDIQPTMGGHYYHFNSKNTLGDMTMDEVVYLTYDPKVSTSAACGRLPAGVAPPAPRPVTTRMTSW